MKANYFYNMPIHLLTYHTFTPNHVHVTIILTGNSKYRSSINIKKEEKNG